MSNTVRIALAISLIAAAICIAILGEAAIPVWLIGLGAKASDVPAEGAELAARVTIGVATALAGVLLALGRRGRGMAIVVAGFIAFSGIADASAEFALDTTAAGLVRPAIQVAVGLIAAVLLLRTKPDPERLRHPLMAGTGVVLAMVAGAAIAGNVQVGITAESITRGRGDDGRFIVHDLTAGMWEDWKGLPLGETGVLEHLPQLRGLSQDQPTLVALYRPNCGACHDLFDGYFGESLSARVIAVEVPPAEGVELVESDLPEDVYCDGCVRLKLPEGPVWLAESPVLVGLVDGKVACVSVDDFQRCVDGMVEAADLQFARELDEANARDAESSR
ncbi:MAG: hypothetical protein CMJ27_00755 [Phycisphaerae bacterium]|nr:hypothetical protein [Phycisphaerae bacterium]